MSLVRRIVPRILRRYLGRLRFPTLFVLTALVFLVNVAVADPIPFVDELLLALVGLMLASLRERGDAPGEGEGPTGDERRPGEEASGQQHPPSRDERPDDRG